MISSIIATCEVFETVQEGDEIALVYPSSEDGSPTRREGTVEKTTPNLVTVKLLNGTGYRSFRYDRIVGDVAIHKNE